MPLKLSISPRRRKSAQALFLREKSIRSKNPSLISVTAAVNPEDRKLKEYARQLREKLRRLYGVNEGQFRRYYDRASKAENTAERILELLESRLDNVIYRSGFGITRPQARQLVSHAWFRVNGKRVNIPSYQVRAGDVITPVKTELFEDRAFDLIPDWIKLDKKKLVATVEKLPTRADIDPDINDQLIVEFYSR